MGRRLSDASLTRGADWIPRKPLWLIAVTAEGHSKTAEGVGPLARSCSCSATGRLPPAGPSPAKPWCAAAKCVTMSCRQVDPGGPAQAPAPPLQRGRCRTAVRRNRNNSAASCGASKPIPVDERPILLRLRRWHAISQHPPAVVACNDLRASGGWQNPWRLGVPPSASSAGAKDRSSSRITALSFVVGHANLWVTAGSAGQTSARKNPVVPRWACGIDRARIVQVACVQSALSPPAAPRIFSGKHCQPRQQTISEDRVPALGGASPLA